MSTTPYAFIKRGNLFITPVGPSIAEVPYPTQPFTKPREFSLWVRGRIEEPAFQLDRVRMPPSLYQEVRDDLVRFSPVEVTRSAFQRSQHAYVGVIDSKGKPYYFALDSRGISIREADIDDQRVWKTFDRLADHERSMATRQRRGAATVEMEQVARELSQPQLVLVKSEIVRVNRDGRQLSVSTAAGSANVPSRNEAQAALQQHLPSGFKVGGSVNLHRASVHSGAPRGAFDSDAIHIMRPSEVAAHGVYGNELHPDHLESIRSAWSEGKQLEPIDVNVTHTGQWHIEDGNHRMHVAAATDAPVALRFRQVGAQYLPQTGIRDISDRLRAAHAAEKALAACILAKADGHTGTMIALHLPREVAERIALPGGELPETMHITLAYLGKNLTDEQKRGALVAVRRFAQQAGPIKALLGGVGRFSASSTSEGRDVVYLSVDSPDITRLRPKLLDELAAEGLEPSNVHGFVPHVTLAYIATSARTPIKRFPPLPVEFPCVSLTVADQKMLLPFMAPTLVITVNKSDRIRGGRADKMKPSDFDPRQLSIGSDHEREHTDDDAIAREIAMDHLAEDEDYYRKLKMVEKALPRSNKDEKVKKTPTSKASKKKAGAGGKTRYTYPNEKKSGAGGGKTAQPLPLVVVQHDDSKNANPAELANQLGVSVRTLQRAAKQLGREGFAKFMRSHLKRFSAKHRIDPDYWGTLHDRLGSTVAKSDAAHLARLSEHVKHVASTVPEGHEGRFGNHVFIDHVHSEMKKRGMHVGSMDEFKRNLVHAHREGHLSLSRADYVAAMPHHHVAASETNADGADFHFVRAGHAPPSLHRDAAVSSEAARDSSAHASAHPSKESHTAASIAHTRAGMAHQRLDDEKTANTHFKASTKHIREVKRMS